MQPHALLPVPAPMSRPKATTMTAKDHGLSPQQAGQVDHGRRVVCYEDGHRALSIAKVTTCGRCGTLIVREDLAKPRA